MSVAIVLELDTEEASYCSCIFVLVARTDPAPQSFFSLFPFLGKKKSFLHWDNYGSRDITFFSKLGHQDELRENPG